MKTITILIFLFLVGCDKQRDYKSDADSTISDMDSTIADINKLSEQIMWQQKYKDAIIKAQYFVLSGKTDSAFYYAGRASVYDELEK